MRLRRLSGIVLGMGITSLAAAASIDGMSVVSGGPIDVGWKASVSGGLSSAGSVNVGSKATVAGDIFSADTLTRGWKASVGTVHEAVGVDNLPGFPLPTVDLTPTGLSPLQLGGQETLNLTPGNYGDLTVGWKSAVTLSAGVYHFDSLHFDSQSKLVLDNSAGAIVLNVAGDARFDWKTRVERFSPDVGGHLTVGGDLRLADQVAFDSSALTAGLVAVGWKTNVSGKLFAHGSVALGDQSRVQGGGPAFPVGTSSTGSVVPEPATMILLVVAGLYSFRRLG
jgi:hypothetical protein